MISFIATVYNEGENIHRLMQSLARQTRLADEIVIVDGGSCDDTVALLHGYTTTLPLVVLVENGANISRGRNLAFEHTHGDVIAISDAGVTLPDDWLERLIAPLEADASVQVACGFFRADPHTVFEVAMGATVLPLASEITPATFLPSSRSVAVRRGAFERVGGYPEWLDYCEDLIFDLRLKQVGTFVFVPEACVWFRPRGTLASFYKQYYLYARGDGKADLWRKRHAIRYLTYVLGAPILLGLALGHHPLWWGIILVASGFYLRTPYQRLPHVMRSFAQREPVSVMDWALALLWIPLIRVVGDVAKMIGYPVGWAWRLRHSPPRWQVLP